SFDVTSAGDYTIHTLVAELSDSTDPNYLDLSVVVPGTTTGGDVLGIVTSNGLCASLDVTGAPIVVEPTLSLNDTDIINSFMVYPNPVVDLISISNAKNLNINSVKFSDVSGRIVKELNFDSRMSNMTFDISEFTSGLYMIQVNSDKGQFIKRIIKK
uniref:T9SS type A sorting domain-containing protein n=1 Tax=uncultured Algibacter sp. TaxID=298659 RepID=UPI00263A2BCA